MPYPMSEPAAQIRAQLEHSPRESAYLSPNAFPPWLQLTLGSSCAEVHARVEKDRLLASLFAMDTLPIEVACHTLYLG